jgi:ketosteroid isomerase-like protein
VTDDEVQAFLRQWWEGVWGEGDVDLVDDLVAERYVSHTPTGTRRLTRAELKDLLVEVQRGLHLSVTAVDDIAVDGDKVWLRATSRGVDLRTGEPALRTWMILYRFEEGLLVEGWTASVLDVDWEA